MAANAQHRCVFVGNIPYDATEELLVKICEEVGPVVSFRLVIDRETGKPKGYGFCEYKDEETALSARRNLQGYEINGRQLRVDFAENDKGADRNREQGRGGPGLTSNVDPQKPLGGPAILGDSALHQPIGLPLAATAASVLAGSLGDGQKGGMSSTQNGLQGQLGLGNDQLTHFMAKMSKNQLYEIMNEMKVMATQNKELARQLLLSSPQLSKALFQAQIMLGMVSPQVLQMPNIRQSPGSLLQPPLQGEIQEQKSAVFPPHAGQIPLLQNKLQLGLMPGVQDGQLSAGPQNALVNNQSSAVPFQQLAMQPRFQHSQQTQSQLQAQSAIAGQPGVSTVPAMRPFTGLPIRPQTPALETSVAAKQQLQLPPLQHRIPVGGSNLGYNTQSAHQNATSGLLLPRALLSQPNFQHGSSNPMVLPCAPETVTKPAERSAQVMDDARIQRYSNTPLGLSEHKNINGDNSDPTNHPSKLARLEDGRAVRTMMNHNTSMIGSGPARVFGSGSLPTQEILSAEGIHHYEKQAQVPQSQLAPDVESALLQQVMSLTPEQLSSLPPEQRQQVIQLQQMLR